MCTWKNVYPDKQLPDKRPPDNLPRTNFGASQFTSMASLVPIDDREDQEWYTQNHDQESGMVCLGSGVVHTGMRNGIQQEIL